MAGGIASRSQKWNCRTNALAGKIVHFAEENTVPIIGQSENSRCFYPPRSPSGMSLFVGSAGTCVAEGMAIEWHRSLVRQSVAQCRSRPAANQRHHLGESATT